MDGDIHAYQESYDAERTAELKALGYEVIRFWNEQVLKETNEVLEVILVVCDVRS